MSIIRLNFTMEYDEYYTTLNEGSRGGGIPRGIWLVRPISVDMESAAFSEDYSGKYYLI